MTGAKRQPAEPAYGECSSCGRNRRLTPDGTALVDHRVYDPNVQDVALGAGRGVYYGTMLFCLGSSHAPRSDQPAPPAEFSDVS